MGRMRKCFRNVLSVCTFHPKYTEVKMMSAPVAVSMTSLARVPSARSEASGRSSPLSVSDSDYPSSGVSSASGSSLSLDVISSASDQWRYLRAALKVVRGSFSQFEMTSQFAGAQCTSIAYVALCWATIVPVDDWTPQHVNDILYKGDTTHSAFRSIMRVSSHQDGRVALDDLPAQFQMEIKGVQVQAYKGDSLMAFLTITPAVAAFAKEAVIPSVKECLEQQQPSAGDNGSGVLITVGDFTYMVTRTKSHQWILFDSHGCLSYGTRRYQQTASVATFATVDGVVEALRRMHKDGTLAQVVNMSVIPDTVVPVVPPQPSVDRYLAPSRLSFASSGESRYPPSTAYTEIDDDCPDSVLGFMTGAYADSQPSEITTPRPVPRPRFRRPPPLVDARVEDVPDSDVIQLNF